MQFNLLSVFGGCVIFFWGGGGKLIADPDSWLDRFIVDDFQLVNFQQKQFVVYSFAPEV
jgi:hypothetical protein